MLLLLDAPTQAGRNLNKDDIMMPWASCQRSSGVSFLLCVALSGRRALYRTQPKGMLDVFYTACVAFLVPPALQRHCTFCLFWR